MKRILALILTMLMMLCTFASCGEQATVQGEKGEQGEQGEQGTPGKDAIAPQIRINPDTNEWEVSSDNGKTWSSTGINATGKDGSDGKDGVDGVNGIDGKNGENGKNGEKGADAIAPQIRINSTTNEWEVSTDNGTTWTSTGVVALGKDGDDGKNGENGKNGEDAVAPQIRINPTTNEWEVSTDSGTTWKSTNVKATGEDGKDAIAPQVRINPTTNWWEVSIDGVIWRSTGVKATGENGEDAVAPQVRINSTTNEWEVSTDDGTTWESTGVKATGENGINGTDGKNGEDAIAPQVRINPETYQWEVSTDNGVTWVSTGVEAVWTGDQYARAGKNITFGLYPQTKVTDTTLTATLNTKAGILPTSENSQSWTSYGYYINGEVQNFMWYIDVLNGSDKYRGVYFTSYRPDDTINSSSTYQDNNGYTTSTVYWFKYEPISWTILSENKTDGTALILCDMIIDLQEYYINTSSRTIDGKTVYPNNYAESTIRKWLNDNFYNTAFNALQKALIVTTTVDNSAATTDSSTNQYACENTEDKIFLPSYQDVINSNYGFSSDYSDYDTARQKKTTDYAQVQGAYTNTNSDYAGNGYWLLRSPFYSYFGNACSVSYNGKANIIGYVYLTTGVVPALQIRL
ncbi:MAG: hypothetical protein E7678_02495 [Ruminococcaceae bacterium]|nr:hypothetical protein [Oscillospiraceae bacterium]